MAFHCVHYNCRDYYSVLIKLINTHHDTNFTNHAEFLKLYKSESLVFLLKTIITAGSCKKQINNKLIG